MDLKEIIKEKLPLIKEIRKELNENPELAFEEYKTQKIIQQALDSFGISNYTCAKTGVVALLNEGEEAIAVRADMDALPINGVSHSCGHDYHMAIGLGTALVLKALGCEKTVKFIFQPAEELIGGAVPMIEAGVLEKPKVKYMIGYHVWPGLEVGKLEIGAGATMASIDDFHITIKGVGGHGAMPHKCKNPILPAVDIIQSLQLKSRTAVDPLKPHVITVSSISAGEATNVIPETALLKGTVRTFDEGLRQQLAVMIKETASTVASNYGCEAMIDYCYEYPPLISHKELTERFYQETTKILGKENILPLEQSFGGDDFAYFSQNVPSVHFRAGIEGSGRGSHPLHSPYFDADEEVLFYAIYAVVNFILNYK